MATLVDGMGGEELGDAGDPGSKVSQLFITGSVTAQAGLRDNLSQVRSAVRSHAGSDYGLFVQAGSVTTDNSGDGTVVFAEPFSNANWMMSLTLNNFTIPGGSNVTQSPGVSGTRRTSGCEVTAGSTSTFDYIAVGL